MSASRWAKPQRSFRINEYMRSAEEQSCFQDLQNKRVLLLAWFYPKIKNIFNIQLYAFGIYWFEIILLDFNFVWKNPWQLFSSGYLDFFFLMSSKLWKVKFWSFYFHFPLWEWPSFSCLSRSWKVWAYKWMSRLSFPLIINSERPTY